MTLSLNDYGVGRGIGAMRPRHPTIRRDPRTILDHWEEWGRRNGAPEPFFELKAEAESFLTWLRAKELKVVLYSFNMVCWAYRYCNCSPFHYNYMNN